MIREYLKTEIVELEVHDDPPKMLGTTYRVIEVKMLGKKHCVIVLELQPPRNGADELQEKWQTNKN